MSKECSKILEPVLKEVYLCPSCGEAAFSEEWDAETLKICTNRKQRRSHVPLAKAPRKGDPLYIIYICPHCKEYIKSYLIERV